MKYIVIKLSTRLAECGMCQSRPRQAAAVATLLSVPDMKQTRRVGESRQACLVCQNTKGRYYEAAKPPVKHSRTVAQKTNQIVR